MISLQAAVEAFQDGPQRDKYWEEYGLSDEDVAHGLRVAFKTLGVAFDDDALFLYGDLATPEGITREQERQRRRAEEKAAWRAANPEAAARQDEIDRQMAVTHRALMDKITDDMFKSSAPLMALLRKKTRLP